MNLRIFILFLAIFCATFVTMAQEQKNTLPDLYTADQVFFDPTRKNLSTEEYQFATQWRLQLGYVQPYHRTQDTAALYMHGIRLGATVDFLLPQRFSLQTGALLSFSYGVNNQHWGINTQEDAQVNILQHNLLQLQLTIPVRAYYNIKVWKKLNAFFYGGPQLNIGLTHYDIIKPHVAASTLQWMEQQGITTTNHDRYVTKQLYRTNIQMGVGGGLEWERYRLQGGYDFGLNNILRTSALAAQKINEWSWYVVFSYQL